MGSRTKVGFVIGGHAGAGTIEEIEKRIKGGAGLRLFARWRGAGLVFGCWPAGLSTLLHPDLASGTPGLKMAPCRP